MFLYPVEEGDQRSHFKNTIYMNGQKNPILNGGSISPITHKHLGWWDRRRVSEPQIK